MRLLRGGSWVYETSNIFWLDICFQAACSARFNVAEHISPLGSVCILSAAAYRRFDRNAPHYCHDCVLLLVGRKVKEG